MWRSDPDTCVLMKLLWCVVQVLVVWDVAIGKARNYRLFAEVRKLLRSIIFWLYIHNSYYLCVEIRHNDNVRSQYHVMWYMLYHNTVIQSPVHCGWFHRRTTSFWTAKWPSPLCQLWLNTTTTILFLTTARSACRSPTQRHWSSDWHSQHTKIQLRPMDTKSKGEPRLRASLHLESINPSPFLICCSSRLQYKASW